MSANPSRWPVDFDQYLRFEREASERHELIDGEIIAMAGATRRHNVLCGRLHEALRPPLGDGPCILERSDQRLGVLTAHPVDPDTRVGPRLLVEVTSKSTEKKDRGVKLEDYLQISTLEEYLIVSHERRELELWTRGAEGWSRRLVTEGSLQMRHDAVLDVQRLYDGLPS